MRDRRRGREDATPAGADAAGEGTAQRRPAPLVTAGAARARTGSRASAPPPRRRSRISRHPLVVGLNFVIFVVLIGVAGAIAALVIGRQIYVAEGPLPEPVQVNIPRGASVQSIASGLEAQDVIASQYVFLAAIYGRGLTRDMKAGEYVIPARATMAEVMDKIVSGEVVQHRLTFPEGLTSAQIVKRLNEADVLSGYIREIPPEGSLLPETYSVTRGMSRDRVLRLMREAHDRVLAEVWENRDPALPLSSPEELVILASIVEKETGVAAERPRVASVFVNRLRRGMRLQSDPTIIYGLTGGEPLGRGLRRSEIDGATPYNTYVSRGLPPTPIANPGRASLEAVLNPAETDDLYFVADGTGGHVFAKTYAEHRRNVANWRRIERERQAAEGQ